MALSSKQLQTVLNEIGSDLIGGVIRRIDPPQAWTIVFEIEHNRKRHHLLFSAHKQHARCHLLKNKYANPIKTPRFCQLLRAHLRHKRIVSFEQLHADCVIEIRMAWNENEETSETAFIAEWTGSTSNLFLLNTQGVIIASLFPPRRPSMAVGEIYCAPQFKHLPSFKETPIPLQGTWNLSIERFYRTLEEKESEAARKRSFLSQLNQAILRSRGRLKNLASRLAEAEAASQFRDYGELLKVHLHELKLGASEFKVIDRNDPEKKCLRIQLNPILSPAENMAFFFQRYKKGMAAKASIQKALDKVKLELKHFECAKDRLSQEGILHPTDISILPKKQQRQKRKIRGPRIYLSKDNMRLMVGRNDRENDTLTFRMANGKDLWFHAQGVPGSHVIVRMERRKELPHQTFLDAAMLALHFSSLKNAGKGEIVYTYKRYIRKVKKGKPGAVLCSQKKTIYISIESGRLKRLFQTGRMSLENDGWFLGKL